MKCPYCWTISQKSTEMAPHPECDVLVCPGCKKEWGHEQLAAMVNCKDCIFGNCGGSYQGQDRFPNARFGNTGICDNFKAKQPSMKEGLKEKREDHGRCPNCGAGTLSYHKAKNADVMFCGACDTAQLGTNKEIEAARAEVKRLTAGAYLRKRQAVLRPVAPVSTELANREGKDHIIELSDKVTHLVVIQCRTKEEYEDEVANGSEMERYYHEKYGDEVCQVVVPPGQELTVVEVKW